MRKVFFPYSGLIRFARFDRKSVNRGRPQCWTSLEVSILGLEQKEHVASGDMHDIFLVLYYIELSLPLHERKLKAGINMNLSEILGSWRRD